MRSDTRTLADGADAARPSLDAGGAGFLASVTGAVPSRTLGVLDAIKHAILTGELRPGQSLVETELARTLGVSKTPVREALKTLAGAGLVTMSPYKGAMVRNVDDDLARSVYDLRLLLEPEALRRAVTRTGRLGAARQALARSAPPPTGRTGASRTGFHRALYRGCGNALLIGSSTTCATRPRWCRRRPGSTRRRGRRRRPSTTRSARGHRRRCGRRVHPAHRAHPEFPDPQLPVLRGRPCPNGGATMPLDPATAGQLKDALATVVVIPVMPMRPDGSPEWGTYSLLIRRVVDAGITVITPNGNTGEFYALTPAEARHATETAARRRTAKPRRHAGRGAGRRRARHSHRGRGGPARPGGRGQDDDDHQPVHPYLSATGWVEYHRAIAGAVPEMGIVLYIRDPRVTGAQIADLGERCPKRRGQVRGPRRQPVRVGGPGRGVGRFTWIAGLAEL